MPASPAAGHDEGLRMPPLRHRGTPLEPGAVEAGPPAPAAPVGWGFIARYTLAYAGATLLLLAPLLVSLALKVNLLVGIDRAPGALALVTVTGSLLAMVANPFFGRLSDRTSSRLGMRRRLPGILTVALAPSIPVLLVGWCATQIFFNALLAASTAVRPDQVPVVQRGFVAAVLAVCLPAASVAGTFLVQLFRPRGRVRHPRLPRRHGRRRTGIRHVHGRRPGPRGRRAAR